MSRGLGVIAQKIVDSAEPGDIPPETLGEAANWVREYRGCDDEDTLVIAQRVLELSRPARQPLAFDPEAFDRKLGKY